MNEPISDKSSLNISLPMLIQAVVGISSLIWIYSQLDSRLSFVEKDIQMLNKNVESLLSLQDRPISSDHIQFERIKYLEKELDRLRDKP